MRSRSVEQRFSNEGVSSSATLRRSPRGHGAPDLGGELGRSHGPCARVRGAGLGQLGQRGGRRKLHQRDAVAVDDEGRLAARLGTPAVVLEERGHQRRQIAHQRFREELAAKQIRRRARRAARRTDARPAPRKPPRRAGKSPLALAARQVLAAAFRLHLLGAFLVLRLQLGEPPARLRVDRSGFPLAGTVERLARLLRRERRRHRLHLRLLGHSPLQQGEGAFGGHRHHLAILVALGHGGEPLPHGQLGILPDVREQVLLQRRSGDLPVMKGFARAPQNLHGRLGESHVTLRGSAGGTSSRLPFRRSEKSRMSLLGCIVRVNELRLPV